MHEDIGPDYLRIGEKTIVIGYFLCTLFFMISNRKEILSSDYLVLGLALSLFAISIFLDAADLDDFERFDTFLWEQFQMF